MMEDKEFQKLVKRAEKEIIKWRNGQEITRAGKFALETIWLRQKKLEGATCERCKTEKNLTLDHILPEHLVRSFVDVNTHYNPKNYQVLCKPCNQFKGNQLDVVHPKTKEILDYYFGLL